MRAAVLTVPIKAPRSSTALHGVFTLALVMALCTLACDLTVETPPHPPADPKLDIVVTGTRVQINRTSFDVTSATQAQVTAALGAEPSVRGNLLEYRNVGVSIVLQQGRMKNLEVYFTPYGLAKEAGMMGFQGRFIVNGAWIHRDAELYHIEAEMGRPCNEGNQGVGGFSKSPFYGSWTCDVGGQPYGYWLKRYYNAEHPLFAFEVDFYQQPYPPQPPVPTLTWSDVASIPSTLVYIATRSIELIIGAVERVRSDENSSEPYPAAPVTGQ